MKYNKHTYILIVFLLISISIKSQIKVTTERFTDQNGLSQNTITSILKDKDGFIWFATKDGISRYDGYSFNNFKISSKEYNCSLNNQFIQMCSDVDFKTRQKACEDINAKYGLNIRVTETREEFDEVIGGESDGELYNDTETNQ